MSEWYFLYFSFVPLVLSLCHREESRSAFFTPPHQAFSDVSSDLFFLMLASLLPSEAYNPDVLALTLLSHWQESEALVL